MGYATRCIRRVSHPPFPCPRSPRAAASREPPRPLPRPSGHREPILQPMRDPSSDGRRLFLPRPGFQADPTFGGFILKYVAYILEYCFQLSYVRLSNSGGPGWLWPQFRREIGYNADLAPILQS